MEASLEELSEEPSSLEGMACGSLDPLEVPLAGFDRSLE